ncbi:MAG: glycosyltransferase [Solirubrobacterales bacterium]
MRIAIVSPYSWTYPGGVNRHVESLAGQLIARGHELRVLAPWDPPDRKSKVLHRAPAEVRARPEYLVTLGRTVGFNANGAVSNLSPFPEGITALRSELRAFAPDVVHVHSPEAPIIGWDACSYAGAPVVGTFHSYSTRPFPNHLANLFGARRKFNQLTARIAVSKAAEWTGRRWYGGSYRIVPNGVDVGPEPAPERQPGDELRVLFVGRAEERKGLPVLLSAFEALTEHVPSRLAVVGAERHEIARYLDDDEAAARIDVHGRVGRRALMEQLAEADVLCAPSLAGESFGMVLTEAFAAGTPVLASNIAGYADVVTDGVDGVLVPPADAQRLAEELQTLYHEPARRDAMARAARGSAERYAWPRVAEQVESVYGQALEGPEPATRTEAAARRIGFMPAGGGRPRPAERLARLDPEPPQAIGPQRTKRRIALGVAGFLGLALTALAASRIGLHDVIRNIVRSDSTWVLVAVALMSASLFMRAGSWFASVRSALPARPVRRRDVTSATMIGVLMSATLPARVGEPARAMVLARRVGRMRETFPVLLGTLVSQTVMNIGALVLLGAIIVWETDLFAASSERLFLFSLAPVLLLVAVMLAPMVVRRGGSGRIARVVDAMRSALVQVRTGLRVFRDPRRAPLAVSAQFTAWALQLAACFVLFDALGLEVPAQLGAAAAVLFAVNVTAVVPATPSNVGVFQLATISVLTTGFGVGAADALAYGIVLQAVEIATAVALGLPALVREGVTWSDMRMRALQAAPVRLSPRGTERERTTVSG